MNAILNRLRYAINRLGRAGKLGLLLCVLAALTEFLVIAPMESATRIQQAKNDRDRQVRRATLAVATVSTMPKTALSPAAEASLRKLFEAADEEGISLDQGDYKLSADTSGGQRRYQLTLPVIGPYPAVRAFLGRALNDEPALALESLELRRESIEDAEIDAVLHFVLMLEALR